MTTTNWIIVAVVALVVIAALAFVLRSVTQRRRSAQADKIREDVREKGERLAKRESIAAETDAKARAAAAEAEAKAAEAARLQDRADSHRSEVDSQREHLDAERERAESLDPRTKKRHARADDEDVDQQAREAQEVDDTVR